MCVWSACNKPIMYWGKLKYTERCIKNHLTGRRSLIIPDLAAAMLSKEPPSAARCSAPTFVMIETARSELVITFVASRAPPNPAYILAKEIRTIYFNYFNPFLLSKYNMNLKTQ